MSRDTTRRTIAELRTLYMTHPRLRDVLVEGPSDRRFFTWFLKEQGVSGEVRVYEVDHRAKVPEEEVRPHHAEVNKRGRLFAIGHAADGWGLASRGVTCIVDADFNALESMELPDPILPTDYPALETYALQDRPFRKFISEFVDEEVDALAAREQLLPTWSQLFFVRWVLHRHSNGHGLIESFAKRCFDKSGKPVLEVEGLIRDSTHATKAEVQRLLDIYSNEAKVTSDLPFLAVVRGHDIAPLLRQYFGLKNSLGDIDHIEALLRACIELVDVEGAPLFRRLLGRVSPDLG